MEKFEINSWLQFVILIILWTGTTVFITITKDIDI